MSYSEVEDWLREVGYEIDCSKPVQGVSESIESSVDYVNHVLDSKDIKWKVHWEDQAKHARVQTTKLGKSPVFTCVWTAEVDATVEDFLKTTYRDDKFKVSGLWDPTYIHGDFVERFGNELDKLTNGIYSAKIASATFKAGPLSKRHLVTLLAPVIRETPELQVLIPCISVKSSKMETPAKHYRAKNLMPSGDRVTQLGNGKVRWEHIFTTEIGGWIGPGMMNSFFKGAYAKAFIHEAEHIHELVKSEAFKAL